MRYLVFCIMAALLVPAVSSAIDTNRYPYTLIDQTCTDANDSPARPAVPLGTFDGKLRATPQTSGSPDGYCDNDPWIVTGALTADTVFGPFALPEGSSGFYMFVDATVVGTTWAWNIMAQVPFDGRTQSVDSLAQQSGSADLIFSFGADTGRSANNVVNSPLGRGDGPVPNPFYLLYNETSATSFTADVGLVPFYY